MVKNEEIQYSMAIILIIMGVNIQTCWNAGKSIKGVNSAHYLILVKVICNQMFIWMYKMHVQIMKVADFER